MEHLQIVSRQKNSNARLGVSQPEIRNPGTGLPEQYFYRPPSPRNIQAAKNGLLVMGILALMSAGLWIEFFREVGR